MKKILAILCLFAVSIPALAVDLAILSVEVNTDPLGRGYAAMTDQEVVDRLHVQDRTRVLSSLDARTILQSVDPAELIALSEANRLLVLTFIGAADTHDPRNGTIAHTFFTTLFPNSATLSNLGAARTEAISRAEELGIDGATANEVARVRAQ